MKKILTLIISGAIATGTFAQGTINVLNGTYSLVRTNATGLGGTAGLTAGTLGGFYYGVFTASSTVTNIKPC